MIYAVSDIHGCYDKYRELLRKISFGPEDTLYVLGDVIDRGPDGFKILLDMASRPNVVNLMGNHEAMAARAIPHIMKTILQDGELTLDGKAAKDVELWLCNGGELSLADFLWLSEGEMQTVWNCLISMPLYKETEVNGRKFVLVHGGLGGFDSSRPLRDYTPYEILWHRPEPDTSYYQDKVLIHGHTPTCLLDKTVGENDSPAQIFRAETFVDIDCGCVFKGGRLGCLRLDDMQEFYAA